MHSPALALLGATGNLGRHVARQTLERGWPLSVAAVYPLYVKKVERKGRSREELNQVICRLTGCSPAALAQQIARAVSFETFFAHAPGLPPNVGLIKGSVCGVLVEDIADPLMRRIRWLDKLVDELAKGRPMEKVLPQ